jgi:hypothetical protein
MLLDVECEVLPHHAQPDHSELRLRHRQTLAV